MLEDKIAGKKEDGKMEKLVYTRSFLPDLPTYRQKILLRKSILIVVKEAVSKFMKIK